MSGEWYIFLGGALGTAILLGIWYLRRSSHSKQQGLYISLDGHLVRSRGEWMIDAALLYLGIRHEYEPRVQIDRHLLHPDFGLGNGIYLEYWGLDTRSYRRYKGIKKNLFKHENLKLVSIESADLKNLLFILEKKLRPLHILEERSTKFK